jgi:copper resistance protein D
MTAIDAVTAALRAAVLLAVLHAGGIALFFAAYAPQLHVSIPAIRKLALWSAAGGALLALLLQAWRAAYLSGAWSGVVDLDMQRLAWSANSAVTLMQIGGCALLLFVSRVRAGLLRWGWLASALLIGSFLATGHTAAHPQRTVLALLLFVHAAVAAFWLGSLPALRLVSRYEPPLRCAQAVRSFSRHAVLAVPLLLAVGLVMAWQLLPNVAALRTSYGLLLVGKFVGFWCLIALAARNQLHWLPRLAAGGAGEHAGFRRTVGVEHGIAIAVVATTAVMTTLFSPDP